VTEPAEPDVARASPAHRGQVDETLDTGGIDRACALELLRDGELSIVGRIVEASNATLLCDISREGLDTRCVYKPVAGERPLWDFPDGTLADRETAAYLVSEAMSAAASAVGGATATDTVGIVPPTVRRDGPFGVGMVQLWVDPDVTVDLVALTRADDPRLRRVALFDAVINNADRKGGHLLPAPSGRVYGIDHGVSFHTDDKLRTLLWTWRGKRLSAAETAQLAGLREDLGGALGEGLADLLTGAEVGAVETRVDRLLTTRRFPSPSGEWPAVPWPPF
jgi:uncharacterized repeat protein (TIGR03843 family)